MSHHNPFAEVFHESVRLIAMGKYEIGSDSTKRDANFKFHTRKWHSNPFKYNE